MRGPSCDLNGRGRLSQGASFDHRVRGGDGTWRDYKAERPGGPEIDGHLELSCTRDWHFGRFGPVENLADVGARLMIGAGDARTVTDQAPSST